MSKEITNLRTFREESNQFYENKKKEVRALGSKLSQFEPSQQISQITAKLGLSSQTQDMLKKVVNRSGQ
jgi:transcription initiation factor TFIIIB Brf1 subunit/transcription initiation factor TFIIB